MLTHKELEELFKKDSQKALEQLIKYGRSESLKFRAGWRESFYEDKDKKERDWQKSNICPKCLVVKARNNKCSMGCDE